MALLSWDEPLERLFEAGVDHGVLYPRVGNGVVWNGLTSVNETTRGGEVVGYYQNGVRRFQRSNPTEFGANLSAFMYPDEFLESDGIYSNGQGLQIDSQSRSEFGLSYRTRVGNSTRGANLGYKLHMIYNAMAQPASKSYSTINNSPVASTFSWELFTRPLLIEGLRASAHVVVDSTKTPAEVMRPLEEILYGTYAIPRLPLPSEIMSLFSAVKPPTLRVSNGVDGQFTVSGSNDTIRMIDQHTFVIDSPGVVIHEDGTYTVSDY